MILFETHFKFIKFLIKFYISVSTCLMFSSERRLTVAVGVHSKTEASKTLRREFWETQDPKWLRSGVGARDAGYGFESYWLWL